MKILIVDDALFLRTTMRVMLEKNGHEIVGEASDGLEAIEKYDELKPDIVTMDITMPRLGGIEATKIILKNHPNASIIMCSAMGREDFIEEALSHGAVDFLTKPFTEEKIIETLKKYS